MEAADATRLDFSNTELDMNRATSLNSQVYTSHDIYGSEMRRIYYKTWLAICHSTDLTNPGDSLVQNIGKKSIIVIRGDDRRLRAFYNVCRHRGSRLLSSSGNLRTIQCAYHGWTYKLDGSLIGCPDLDTYSDSSFDRRDYPLYPVRLESWGGFAWVNLDQNAQPLQSYLGDFHDRFEKYRTEDLKHVATVGTYDVACNWKVLWENFNECYHCPTVHPETLKKYYRDFRPFDTSMIGGPYVMLHWKDCDWDGQPARMSEAQEVGPQRLALSDEEARTQWLPLVFPNFQFTFTPDWVMTVATWPNGPESTRLNIELYAYDWATSGDFGEMIRLQDFVIRQDIKICETQQAGHESEVFDGCRFNTLEENIHGFQRLYARAMSAAPK